MIVFKKPGVLPAILTVLMLVLQVSATQTLTASAGSAQPISNSYNFVDGSVVSDEECISNVSANFSTNARSVEAISDKGLSNVVLRFIDGAEQKFEINDGSDKYSLTFSGTGDNAGKELQGVWIKSGCFKSGDGSGYGEYIEYVTQEQP